MRGRHGKYPCCLQAEPRSATRPRSHVGPRAVGRGASDAPTPVCPAFLDRTHPARRGQASLRRVHGASSPRVLRGGVRLLSSARPTTHRAWPAPVPTLTGLCWGRDLSPSLSHSQLGLCVRGRVPAGLDSRESVTGCRQDTEKGRCPPSSGGTDRSFRDSLERKQVVVCFQPCASLSDLCPFENLSA